ncbi:HlyD family type I secretion periplasmic adaptor subunit [Ochrobactrum sp. Marseille-Q0166]|uniref:HlyD family type I secretion periplasmic adaptor subunit n=1 Tax=Ochrobactrum sp. Marseille-Q0166 TaxID=2761105 RepID=UPI0016563721|nr:HlyD family type I secretion periplasmic adaptor subunit [Ochrobactrum sp. Marseille-Q0166]MBC8716941.1 HlyD family type I secretion periplasmic adaptor subunit [Ochrobactrum sp. Marseille-Q0166]
MSAIGGDFGAWVTGSEQGQRLKKKKRFVRLVFVFFIVLVVWSYLALLDEVSNGTGKVVPTSQEQVIQSLEGGVVASLMVRQDDVVEPGQILAQLDPTVTESSVQESAAKYRAALASSARLSAEVSQAELKFSPELDGFPLLKASEIQLFEARKQSLMEALSWITESKQLVQDELNISQSLTKMGAASNVEVIRLKRQLVELQLKETEIRSDYIVQAREELAKANAEVESLSSVIRGRTDALTRLTLRSPVRGIVKNIEVATIGGVVPPNGKLMVIVPLDEQLLIETRISPRDIAYIHPDQRATVKITAYDYSIYGGLEGKVVSISADTIQDETKPENYYYRVFIKTEKDALLNKNEQRFPIVPGMVATVDIHTGSKTVFDYLVKPLNRASEALRER